MIGIQYFRVGKNTRISESEKASEWMSIVFCNFNNY